MSCCWLLQVSHLPPETGRVGVRFAPRPACPACTPQGACGDDYGTEHCQASVLHGSAGVIFSAGLMRLIDLEGLKSCVAGYQKLQLTGDAMLSLCLFKRYNTSFTDPGSTIHYNYDGFYRMFSSDTAGWALHSPMFHVVKGTCDQKCKWHLNHAVTFQVKGKHYVTADQVAAAAYASSASMRAAHKYYQFLDLRRERLNKLAASRAAAGSGSGSGSAVALRSVR